GPGGRSFAAHRPDGDNEVANLDLGLGGSARADTQEGVDAELVQLLDRDRHRRSAHARRDRRDRDTEEAAGESSVLAVEGDLARTVEILGDRRGAAGVTGHENVFADLALGETDVVLLFARHRHRTESLLGTRYPVLVHPGAHVGRTFDLVRGKLPRLLQSRYDRPGQLFGARVHHRQRLAFLDPRAHRCLDHDARRMIDRVFLLLAADAQL